MKKAVSSYKSLNTIKRYLGLNGEDYWHIDYPVYQEEYDGQHYFLDISKKASMYHGEFDENGIYLYRGSDGNNYYSVINLAQYAIGSYLLYLNNNMDKWKREFIKHCDWLIDNQEKYFETEGVWVNRYPVKTFDLYENWASSLCQAFGISALTRAYMETGKEKYINGALKAVNIFFVDVSNKGVLREKEKGFICLEEYPTGKPSYVLNGYIFSILYKLTGMEQFKKYAEKWEGYSNNLFCRGKAFLNKVKFRLNT